MTEPVAEPAPSAETWWCSWCGDLDAPFARTADNVDATNSAWSLCASCVAVRAEVQAEAEQDTDVADSLAALSLSSRSAATESVPTYDEVLASKHLSDDELVTEYRKLCAYVPDETKRSFIGNPILYHYQMGNLCHVATKSAASFYDIVTGDESKREDWWAKVNRYAAGSRPLQPALRFFEVYRRLTGPVIFFRPTVAANLYTKLNATAVLDPCAGWGGRLLAAAAKGIAYTGIDTNVALKPAYETMIATLGFSSATMIWADALSVDFATIDYDCVLTSPPYVNVELYQHMSPFKSDSDFYTTFLIPLINKCRASIRRGGSVCFNISPKMYAALLKHGYRPCDVAVPMLQQKIQGKDKSDCIYCWS
jgi:hypothetical protein